jgi:hypothetical protein
VDENKEDRMLKNAAMVIAACLLALPVGAQEGGAAGPRMVVPQKIKDMGTVAQGEVVEVDFEILNEGNLPLLVKAVRPTCGCTVADYDKEIAAGESGAVKAKLDTKDFSGPISKSILIMTNDPQDPTVSVVIKTNVEPFIEILPRPLIRFNAVQREEMSQKVIVVATEPERNFDVVKVDTSVPYLTTSLRELDEDELIAGKSKKQYELSLEMTEDAPVGPVSAKLVVHTDHPKAKQVVVKVYGVVRALLHVTPSQIQFGTVEAAVRPGRNLIVVNNRSGGAKVQLTDVSVNDPAFAADVLTIEEGRRYQVTVSVSEDADVGTRDAVLTLKTTDPDFPELSVPVRANIR